MKQNALRRLPRKPLCQAYFQPSVVTLGSDFSPPYWWLWEVSRVPLLLPQKLWVLGGSEYRLL